MVARVHICFGAGLLAFAMLASLAFAEPQPVAVSFEQLEKVPWKFNGRRVSVTGYLDVDAEFRASSAGPSRPGDTIFVDMTPAQAEGLAHMPVKRCEKRYIHIVGTFQHEFRAGHAERIEDVLLLELIERLSGDDLNDAPKDVG